MRSRHLENLASALDYVACLNSNSWLGFADWRLLNDNELESLVNAQQPDSATWLNGQGFGNVQAYYWSANTYASNPAIAWLVAMNDGVGAGNTADYFYVWPVRGGQSSVLLKSAVGAAGTVTPDSGSLTWTGATGTASYPEDTVVTLTAIPDTGNVFTGWSGACSGAGACQVTMDAAKDVTATFNIAVPCASPSTSSAPTSNTTGSYTVSWGPTNIAGATYVLEESKDGAAYAQVYSGLNRSVALSGKTSGSYLYRVKAIKTNYANSPWKTSSTVSVTR